MKRRAQKRQKSAKEVLNDVASIRQRRAARQNVKKAAQAAKEKRTIAHLPKEIRAALGKEDSKAAKRKKG